MVMCFPQTCPQPSLQGALSCALTCKEGGTQKSSLSLQPAGPLHPLGGLPDKPGCQLSQLTCLGPKHQEKQAHHPLSYVKKQRRSEEQGAHLCLCL